MPLSEILKQETQKLHVIAESHNPSKKIMDGSITEEEFVDFLQKNQYAYKTASKALKQCKEYLPEYLRELGVLEYHQLLQEDLEAMNKNLQDNLACDLTVEKNLTNAIGILYVLQGSMLGTLLLRNKIGECKNLDNICPKSFFALKPGQISKDWSKFLKYINNINLSTKETEQCIDSAQKTFELFIAVYS